MIVLAIITARKNSKRLKNKNRKILGKKPLVNWTIDFARKIKIFKHILMTTDDEKIFKLAKNKDILVPWIRPKKLALDHTSSYSTVSHALKWYEKNYSKVDCICLLQPTTPFRSKKNLLNAFKVFKSTGKSVVSVMRKKLKNPFLFEQDKKKLFNSYFPSGSFFFISPAELNKYKSFINKDNNLYLISSDKENIDINTTNDWKSALRYVN